MKLLKNDRFYRTNVQWENERNYWKMNENEQNLFERLKENERMINERMINKRNEEIRKGSFLCTMPGLPI